MVLVIVWRIFLLTICCISFLVLMNRFRTRRQKWNTKTRDYWYALTMWSFAGIIATGESIARGIPFRYGIVFTSAAAIATFFGVMRPGSWGDSENKSDE